MQLDELVVRLVLDASGFAKGQKDAATATGKLKQGIGADAKAIEESVAKVSTGVEGLARKFLGLYALVTAGRGLREFVSDLTSADSALGRTAKNLDLSVKGLSTWQNAATVAGGSAAGITGAMQSLSGELQRAALTGQSSVIPAFKAMGINLATANGKARDVRDIFRDLNRVAQGMDPARFNALAHLAGISDEGTISMLEMQTTEFNKLIAAQEKYAATAADADAAQKRQSGWRELLITSTAIGRTILTAVTPALLRMMDVVQTWANKQDWTKLSKPISDFLDRLTNADWHALGKGLDDFTESVKTIATTADGAAKGISSGSLLYQGLTALGTLAGVHVLGSVVALTAGLGRLSSIPVTGLLARILMNPVLAGTLGIGAILASGDPDKALLSGGKPDVQPQDNDLGLPGVGEDRPSDTSRPQSVVDWIKNNWKPDFGKAGEQFKAFLKATGFGDRLPKDETTGASVPPERPASTYSGLGEDGNALRRNDEVPVTPPPSVAAQQNGLWATLKRLVGFGDDPKVKENVETTAKATTGIFDLMRNSATAGAEGSAERGGEGGGGGAHLGDRLAHGKHGLGGGGWKGNYGQKGWWTDERQSHAVDYLMKNAGLTEDGAKALVSRWRYVESPGGPTAVNPNSGAEGIAQWLGSRKGDGSKGSFDEQLAKVARELATSETRAKRLLNTPGSEARGASAFERAEGWNPATATDNFTGRVAEGMKHIAHGAQTAPPAVVAPSTPTAAPSPAGTSVKAVTDAEVFAARQRITAGGRDPKDQALIGRYLKEQNTPPSPVVQAAAPPKAAPVSQAPNLGAHYALHRALVAIGHANKLTAHSSGPIPVDVTERSAERIGKSGRDMLHDRQWGGQHAHITHALDRAFHRTSDMREMLRRTAVAGNYANSVTHHIDRSSTNTTTIHGMHVHTQAKDGPRLMADIENHLARAREVPQFNSGLA